MSNYNIVTSDSDVSLSVGKAPPITIKVDEKLTQPSQRPANIPPEWGWYTERTVTEYKPVQKQQRPIKQKKVVTKNNSNPKRKKLEPIELYAYMKDLYYDKAPYNKEYYHQALKNGLKASQTQVTTLLLYASDLKGMNRPDLVLESYDVIFSSASVGYTFRQTLLKGLIWRHQWKLVFKALERKIDSKTRAYIFAMVKSALQRGNEADYREIPRQGVAVNRVRGYLKMTPADWRHALVDGSGSNLPTTMSSNQWSFIDYAKLPVYYISKWYKGFMRHDRLRFIRYLQANRQIAKTSYQIKHHFRKRPFLSVEDVINTYRVPMTNRTTERKSTNGRHYSQRPREFKRGRA